MVTICFHENNLSIRGTTVALYDYALYNQTLLNNTSIIAVPISGTIDEDILKKFSIFKILRYSSIDHLDSLLLENKCDILYCIKYGTNDGIFSKKIKTVIHCVFDLSQPHGDVYCAVSSTLARKFNTSLFVPHMIGLKPSDTKENLRSELKIPNDAIVFGRHGGQDTFNLNFCMDVINDIVNKYNNIYFVFVNTPKFSSHKQVFFIDKIISDSDKNKFINTCDAHLECSNLGHTMGLSMGEFAVNNKPIIAYNGWTWNHAHFEILGDNALYFSTPEQFYKILTTFNPSEWNSKDNNHYKQFSPENVMNIFKKVFID